MKNGKISESVLKRSVLKQLHTESSQVLVKSAVGGNYAAIEAQKGYVTMSCSPITMEIRDYSLMARMAVNAAVNNIAAAGCKPVGIMITVLLPTTENEACLREFMKEIDKACQNIGIVVMGGHTQVTRAVKNLVCDVTALGMADESHRALLASRALPGMDIIITGYVGLEGTALLAIEREEELSQRFSAAFIDRAKRKAECLSILSEAAVAVKSDAIYMHDISEGGVFGALWDMAEASGVGLDIDLKKIPICQETVEISEFFDLNPYKLLSSGSLLIAASDGNDVVRHIEAAGGKAVVVGKATDSNDRVLIQGEERRFLETAQTDEIYRVFK